MPSLSVPLRKLLRCPLCQTSFDERGSELVCTSGHRYPVLRGIPRLVNTNLLSTGQQHTADAFGYAWTHYSTKNPYTEEQWRDWVAPLAPPDFEDRLVLDAGCGLGGFAEYAKAWGARQVIGVDVSEAVDAAHERLTVGIDIVQADLHELPFAPGTFDLAYSIGVLHHLPDPALGLAAVAKMVRPGGLVFAWVYGRENNGWIIYIVDPIRKHVFTRLPRWVTKWIVSLPAAIIVWALVKIACHVRKVPYAEYLRWLGARDFAFTHGVVFDHLVAPTSHYVRREEFEVWLKRAGLEDVVTTPRNGNSWRGLGRRPIGVRENRPTAAA